MKNKNNNIARAHRSRRTFLKSSGLFITGLFVFKPVSVFGSKANHIENSKSALLTDSQAFSQDSFLLPEGVKAVWDLNKAYRETTLTRERICINGLWQWQPSELTSMDLPSGSWGYFKVPGTWPNSPVNNTENQKLYDHPSWTEEQKKDVIAAWYQREMVIPLNWKNRRIILSMDYINSNAIVFIDGQKAGELWYPAGELDLTTFCKPGVKHILTIKLKAVPLKDVITAYSDTNMGRQVQPTVARRGICGDVFVSGIPKGPSVGSVAIETSYRKGEITFKAGINNLLQGQKYKLRILITEQDKKIAEFTSMPFTEDQLVDGRIIHVGKWMPEKLWDTHTPQNMYSAEVSLTDVSGKLLDAFIPERFGFRELWIDGRDFYLNGSRIWLASIPLDNAQSGVFPASYEGSRMSFERLKATGVNFMYAHNYDSEPGSHISFAEVLKAADDTGMLISQSQPHFSAYDWDGPDADRINGYAHHAEFYTRVAGNHPSVVFYSTSHNATGYAQDMNPEQIGSGTRMEGSSPSKNVPKALRAEAIVKKLDPGRILYHHASGNLSSTYVCNFYGNWVPLQEMNEWFGNWAKNGELPAMLLEYATPFTWDFGMYRGWYKGKRAFGEAIVPWEFCLAEWKAQFIGDVAYSISEYEKENLRWEAKRFSAGEVWGRSEYPYGFDSNVHDDRNMILAEHHASNWRAFRTWGVSAVNSMWHFTQYWRLKKDVEKKPMIFKTDWETLQKPGYSPDIVVRQRERFDMGYEMSDWEETIAAKAITENQGPFLAYIGGKDENFTDKAHNFLAGESFDKQLIIVNNSRLPVSCECKWELNLPKPVGGSKTITIDTGIQERIPIRFELPEDISPGEYVIKAEFLINKSDLRKDNFRIHVLAGKNNPRVTSGIALLDPAGDSAKLLDRSGISYRLTESGSDLSANEVLIIGKGALKAEGPGSDLSSVRDGRKVIVFEQTADVMALRFGFRVQEYGLRKVFRRIAGHPVFEGISDENLRDWKGEATIISPKLENAPEYKWCGIPVTRAWRCGTRGNLASVLIEKPSCGNFIPVIDGGFSLQYSPLMEFRDGKGMILFCQLDVSGRTEADPAAELLVRNIISYVTGWKPSAQRIAVYAGDPSGKAYLERAAIAVRNYEGGKLQPVELLIAGPGSGPVISKNIKFINKWLKAGGQVLTVGLEQPEINLLLPGVQMKKEEHIAAYFKPSESASRFAGISPADVHNRAPHEFSLVASGANVTGNGMLAESKDIGVTICQLVPWQLDYSREQHNIKQTFRRSAFLLNRLLGNLGVASSLDFLARFSNPVEKSKDEKQWLSGLYLDVPEEWDDPYRFFRW